MRASRGLFGGIPHDQAIGRTIFPRCRRLNIDGGLLSDYPWRQLFTGFLHEGIQDVRIFVAGQAPNDIPNFLEEVVWRSPNVTSLSLESLLRTWDADIAVSLSSSIAMMHKLTVVITYSCLLTAQMLSSLEQLPNLQDVEFYSNSYRLGRVSNGLLPQSVRPHPFPSLTSLSIQSSLVEFSRYLSLASGIAPALRHLFLDIISMTKPSHFQNALVKIAEAFPLLETLQVSRKEDFSMFEGGFADSPVLSRQNLLPIANMRSLRTLRVRCEAVFSMTNSELCALLSRCTSLITLELNQEPMVLSPTELTIHVLPMIAKACPQLEDLALYIDTGVGSEYPPTQSFWLEPFVILEWISFGISPLQNKQVIATLLSQVLPEDCELKCEPLYDSDVEREFICLSAEDAKAREACRKEWAQVAEWIPILKEARRQGRLEAMNGLGAVDSA